MTHRRAPAGVPPDVHVGQDGWLFWIGRPGVILPLYGRRLGTWLRLRAWANLAAERAARARSFGCRYVQFVVPDKLSVYDHKLADPIIDPRRAPGLRLGRMVEARCPGVWADAFGPLRAARDDALLYLKTDTHWSGAGYRMGYRLLCGALGATPAAHVMKGGGDVATAARDIGVKFSPPWLEAAERPSFERRAARIDQNGLVLFRESRQEHVAGASTGSRVVTRNEADGVDPRRVMVHGTSYTFDPDGLGAMLGEAFSEVHCLWSQSIDWAYVERVRPDILVNEVAERFLFRVPVDGQDNEAFAAERLRELETGPAA